MNDLDSYICNFWRAVQAVPDEVARHCDWPVNEADLLARHRWLVETAKERMERVKRDPEYFNAKVAGWWVWGQSLWIGRGWCVPGMDGTGRVNDGRKTKDIHANRPHLSHWNGVHCLTRSEWLYAYMAALQARLRRVSVCCGDWTRVLTPAVTTGIGLTAVFLDPPYARTERDSCYAYDTAGLSADVRAWALAHGDDPKLRIALCGYEGEHVMPDSWEMVKWKAGGGYARSTRGKRNRHRERIWFSPNCLRPTDRLAFDEPIDIVAHK